jgi:hypothetical protein
MQKSSSNHSLQAFGKNNFKKKLDLNTSEAPCD